MSDDHWGSRWERFIRFGMKPIDRYDDDYLLIWGLLIPFAFFAICMFIFWKRST
jgi:hypothetical protein